MSPRIFLIACLVLALTSCRTSTDAPRTETAKKQQLLPPPSKPYMGTQQTRTEIQDLLARVPSSGPGQLAQIQMRLARMGEAAIVPLSDALSHPTVSVRSTAAYALGQIKDPRALDSLASRLADPDEGVRFEVATAMLRMDDHRGTDTMIYGLEHPDPRIRARSILVLQERTGQTKGYKADDAPIDRSAAVARWRAWAQSQRRGW